MSIVTLKVPNISCDHCVHTIKTEVAELEGIRRVDADPTSKVVTVEFEAPATQAAIEARLVEIAYPPETLLSL